MTKLRFTFVSVLLLATLAGCGGGASYLQVAGQRGGQSIAVVSLTVGRLGGWRDITKSDFMYGYSREIVSVAEQQLAGHYAVVPAESFVSSEYYQSLAQPRPNVVVPNYDGYDMPYFGYEKKHLVKARVAPEMAQALAQAAGTDLIAIIFTEWGTKTGSFVPTSKALVRTTLTIHDASGRLLFSGRRSAVGERTVGAFGGVALDEQTIQEWMGAYVQSVIDLVSG